MTIKKCKYCGKEFRTFLSNIKRGQGIFCSRKCRFKMIIPYNYNKVKIECKECGKIIMVSPSYKNKKKYCSRKCQSIYIYKKNNINKYICPICKKQCSSRYKNKVFCSNNCYFIYRKNHHSYNYIDGSVIKKKCITCGREFMANKYDSLKGMGNYCSRDCFSKNIVKRTNTLHNRVGSGGKREDLNNIYFRSRWEANYARYLNLLVKCKEIIKWEFEPDTFSFDKIKKGTKFYTPDFKVFNNDGTIEYHEVKGWMDRKSQTKIKRMRLYYPNIKLFIIDKSPYYEIKKKVSSMIPFWE